MTFLEPWRLLLLTMVLALAVLYLVMQRRRATYALRFSASDLFDAIAPNRPGFRRHVPAGMFLLALASLVLSIAIPARDVEVPVERATVIIAIDVSLSMQAQDVDPTRLVAAQVAANRFIDELPPTLNVGVVSFAGTASILVTPTRDRTPAKRAIDNLMLSESTAVGEAIFTSLDALLNTPPDGTGSLPPARIILLSDGETTVGRSDSEAIQAANEAQIPVSTIAFGTPDGFILYDDPATAQIESDAISTPVRERPLEFIADQTGGSFFSASTLEELDAVYEDIGSAVGYETVTQEIADWFAALGLALLVASAGFSLLWFQRLP